MLPIGEGAGGSFGHQVSGAWAALRVPWYLRGSALEGLVRAPAAQGTGAGAFTRGHDSIPGDFRGPDGEVRAAIRALRLLARLRIPPFRNTCLFRSVAECLVLRRNGIPAVVRIGVRNDPGTGAVLAHAWVECVSGADASGNGRSGDEGARDGHRYVVFNPEGAAPDLR